MDGNFDKESTNVTKVWTRLQWATRRIQMNINVKWILDASWQPTAAQ
jgi:hypothetical protein